MNGSQSELPPNRPSLIQQSIKPSYKLYIDGQYVEAVAGEYFQMTDPVTEKKLCLVAEGREDDVVLAIQAGKRAFEETSK